MNRSTGLLNPYLLLIQYIFFDFVRTLAYTGHIVRKLCKVKALRKEVARKTLSIMDICNSGMYLTAYTMRQLQNIHTAYGFSIMSYVAISLSLRSNYTEGLDIMQKGLCIAKFWTMDSQLTAQERIKQCPSLSET